MERYTHTLVRFADHVKNMASKQGRDRLFAHDGADEIGELVTIFNTMIKDEDRKSSELLHVSTHDALTGLYNRAFFDAELERMSRGRMAPVSVVVADIDLLKECNDTLGHAAGDILIMAAATSLQSHSAPGILSPAPAAMNFACCCLRWIPSRQRSWWSASETLWTA